MKVKLIKFENFYKAPERKHYNDAGADVYIPIDVTLKPHETVTIALGFGIALPDGFVAWMATRSGCARNGIISQEALIDSGYRGELHSIVTNTTDEEYTIKKGDRISNLVVVPCVYCDFVDELGKERNLGCFNSTGK